MVDLDKDFPACPACGSSVFLNATRKAGMWTVQARCPHAPLCNGVHEAVGRATDFLEAWKVCKKEFHREG